MSIRRVERLRCWSSDRVEQRRDCCSVLRSLSFGDPDLHQQIVREFEVLDSNSWLLNWKNQNLLVFLRVLIKFCSCFVRNLREESDVGEFESDSWSDDSDSVKLSRSLSNNSSRGWDAASEDSSFDQEGCWPKRDLLGYLYAEYFEKSAPYGRIPLMDKVISF